MPAPRQCRRHPRAIDFLRFARARSGAGGSPGYRRIESGGGDPTSAKRHHRTASSDHDRRSRYVQVRSAGVPRPRRGGEWSPRDSIGTTGGSRTLEDCACATPRWTQPLRWRNRSVTGSVRSSKAVQCPQARSRPNSSAVVRPDRIAAITPCPLRAEAPAMYSPFGPILVWGRANANWPGVAASP